MDRNRRTDDAGRIAPAVALRKESVDRNVKIFRFRLHDGVSLSARRAWIEIGLTIRARFALMMSLSARRAWIEIMQPAVTPAKNKVALRKESVDRNLYGSVRCAGRAVALRKESVDRNVYPVFVF